MPCCSVHEHCTETQVVANILLASQMVSVLSVEISQAHRAISSMFLCASSHSRETAQESSIVTYMCYANSYV